VIPSAAGGNVNRYETRDGYAASPSSSGRPLGPGRLLHGREPRPLRARASPAARLQVQAVIGGGERGRDHSNIKPQAVLATVACMLLVRRQLTAASPLLPVDLLRIPIFTLSICTSIASFCAQILAFVALPFDLSEPKTKRPTGRGRRSNSAGR
jgi:hypothetical protein